MGVNVRRWQCSFRQGSLWLGIALAALSATVAGCTPSPEVAVQVLTDLTPVTQFDEIVVERDGVRTSRVVSNRDRFDQPRAVVEYRDISAGAVLQLAAELRLRGATVLRRTRSTTVQGSHIVLFTFNASCTEIRCPMGDPAATECSGGRCVVPGCVGNACVEPECADHADCAPRSSCESPRCVEGTCFQFADPALCANDEVCVATMGCQPRLPDPDGGTLDAAVDPDSGPRDAGLDAGVLDAGASDAGGLDAGGADTGVPDAGRDAGPGDAGPRDAGAQDAGRDAGTLSLSDSGVAPIVDCAEVALGTVCRPSRGPCDLEEVCTSRGCPADRLADSTVVCRRAAGPCDVEEVCSGTSLGCGRDAWVANGTRCNQSCGPETCSSGVCTGGMECAPGLVCCSDSTCSSRACL
jgi:hypothetical protein